MLTRKTPPLTRPSHRPVSFDWVERAARLPGKSLHVALSILWAAAIDSAPVVRVSRSALDRFSVSRDACYDALKHMEDAGLVRVRRLSGRRTVVTLLDRDGSPMRMVPQT